MMKYIEICLVVSNKIFKSFLYRYVKKIIPVPWRLCVFTNYDGLENLDRGSPKEHFAKLF